MLEEIYEYLKSIDYKSLSMQELNIYYVLIKDYEMYKKTQEDKEKWELNAQKEKEEKAKHLQELSKLLF